MFHKYASGHPACKVGLSLLAKTFAVDEAAVFMYMAFEPLSCWPLGCLTYEITFLYLFSLHVVGI